LVVIVFGIVLISFRDFYAALGQKGGKIPKGNQIYKWNAIIVGAGFILIGAYWLYLNLMKYGH
jgi:hypothetical protein